MTKKEKTLWNQAVDACIARLIREFYAPSVVIGIIEKVKQ